MTVRLNVNIGGKVAAELHRVAASEDITITEAVRRAVSVWVWIEGEKAAGRSLAVVSEDGATVRQVVFP